jgi:hypothetical protein
MTPEDAKSDRTIFMTPIERPVIGNTGSVDDLPGLLSTPCQVGYVGDVQVIKHSVQLPKGPGDIQHVPVCLRRDGEPVRHSNALVRELGVHLTEGRVLPPDERNVVVADLLKKPDEPGASHVHSIDRGVREW